MAPAGRAHPSRRVTLVTDELLGYTKTGGLGTATSFLAVALARMGHLVELLYVGEPPLDPLAEPWNRLYESAGVAVRRLERSGSRIEPSYFSRMHDTELALRADPPDVVITQDLGAPAYTALRMRRLGLAFPDTTFVVYCHGTRLWITDMAQKVRVLPGALAVSVLEQASVELADAVVAPSAYVLGWMRGIGWRLPAHTRVIPYFSRSAATGETPPASAEVGTEVVRLAFFGRLEERKGLRPFAAALNMLEPELLRRVELEFVGAATAAWPPERVEALLSDGVRTALRSISFETTLDQPEALAHLSRPGTLAVMPSAGETFSNAVYECLERGIPFIASNAGAPPELVAEADHDRVLFEPTATGIAGALRHALRDGRSVQPARLAFDPNDSVEAWQEVVGAGPATAERVGETDRADYVLVPPRQIDGGVLDTLSDAAAASGADVVTCGVRTDGLERFFLGDPGGLGLVANHYGTVALVRRSLLGDGDEREAIWPLLARLALDGARIVSIPQTLVDEPSPPASVEREPAEALRVREHFERALPDETRSLARLAAGLAADRQSSPAPRSSFRKLARLWRR